MDVLASLKEDTPHLPAVRRAAAEMPDSWPPAAFSGNMDDVAEQFAMWRQTDTSLLEPLLQIMPGDDLPCRMAAVLASVPSFLPFHNHHHMREVAYLAMLLARDHAAALRSDLFIAACIHDFMHDGMGNQRGGRHTPMRLERRALDAAAPYLLAAGLSDAAWQRISLMVLSTDVSKPGAGAVSPAEWMRRACRGQDGAGCPQELEALFSDPALARQAALLEDADLGISAGLAYDFAKRMTALIAEETRVLSPTPQTLIGFIDHICQGSFITPEGKALFGDNMAQLRREAESETADTIYIWS